jgi:xanthosine utilization system XapX-like protein
MDPAASRLPAVLGSVAALTVGIVSFMVQVPPPVCAMRSLAAFVVFSAFGVVIRYLLGDAPRQSHAVSHSAAGHSLADIPPGTSVEELLAAHDHGE